MQIRRPLARAVVVLVALGAILAATAQPASAHATFLGAPSVRVGEDVRLTLDVPHERDEETLNAKVRISLPTGWSSVYCEPFATWTCSAAGTVIEFVKQVGADPAQDETFIFSVRAGTAGLAVFPVQQIYSSGEDVLWQDTAQLRVSPAVSPTTRLDSESTSTSGPDQDSGPVDPGAGPARPVDGSSATNAATEGSDGVSSAAVDVTDEAAAGGTDVSGTDAGGNDRAVGSTGDPGSSVPIVLSVILAAVVALGVGLVLLLRRRVAHT